MTNHDSRRCRCSNCAWTGREDSLTPIKDILERVAPGEILPAGECPACGAVAHLDEPGKAALLGALTVCVNWIENHHAQAGYTRLPACAVAGRRMLRQVP